MKFKCKGFESVKTSSYELPLFPSPIADLQAFKQENKIDVFLKDGDDFPKVRMTPLKYIKRLFHVKVYESDTDITVVGRFEKCGPCNQYRLVRYGICNKCGLVGQL